MDIETKEMFEKLDRNLERRFDQIDNRFDGLEQRMDGLEKNFTIFVGEMKEFRTDMYEFRDFVKDNVVVKSELEDLVTVDDLGEFKYTILTTVQSRLEKERIITEFRLNQLESKRS
jgi:hypothetical protein